MLTLEGSLGHALVSSIRYSMRSEENAFLSPAQWFEMQGGEKIYGLGSLPAFSVLQLLRSNYLQFANYWMRNCDNMYLIFLEVEWHPEKNAIRYWLNIHTSNPFNIFKPEPSSYCTLWQVQYILSMITTAKEQELNPWGYSTVQRNHDWSTSQLKSPAKAW